MIELQHIQRSFQDQHILKGISAHINTGAMTAIVGPSGCGKTTLLQIIGGLDKPSAGSVIVNHTDIHQLSHQKLAEFRNRHFGYVFQQYYLIPRLSALDNVALPLVQRYQSSSQARVSAEEILVACGLGAHMKQTPETLSAGQQQRVALARALIGKPSVVLADEPTGALDSHHAHMIFDMLKKLSEQGITVILITHDQTIAQDADHRIHMLDGEIHDIT